VIQRCIIKLTDCTFGQDYRAASRKSIQNFVRKCAGSGYQAAVAHKLTDINMTFVLQHVPKDVAGKENHNGDNALDLVPIGQQCV
jgi:hypothetical protein